MNIKILGIILITFFFSKRIFSQNVGIGTLTPDTSAKLELFATNKGYLLPRMTFAQRNAINNPAKGLKIWCTDCDEMQVYDGFIWLNMSGNVALGPSFTHIKICYDVWMYKNLSVSKYKNGDPIPVVTDSATWANLTTGAMCWYNNDSTSYNGNYGALYNWYAVNDPRGLAPDGWHISTLNEWLVVLNCVGGNSVAGGKLKAISPLWTVNPNVGATNRTGFTGLPGGYRDGNKSEFSSNGTILGAWWTANEYGSNKASMYYLINNGKMIMTSVAQKTFGFSVRCIKD